jgi:hypothetical protein
MNTESDSSKLSPADQLKLERLRADIAVGIKDIEEGRVSDWDVEEILKSARAKRDSKMQLAPSKL